MSKATNKLKRELQGKRRKRRVDPMRKGMRKNPAFAPGATFGGQPIDMPEAMAPILETFTDMALGIVLGRLLRGKPIGHLVTVVEDDSPEGAD